MVFGMVLLPIRVTVIGYVNSWFPPSLPKYRQRRQFRWYLKCFFLVCILSKSPDRKSPYGYETGSENGHAHP